MSSGWRWTGSETGVRHDLRLEVDKLCDWSDTWSQAGSGQDLGLGTGMICSRRTGSETWDRHDLGWKWTGSGTRDRHDLLKVDRI
jgi:hypothetical protein